MTDLKSKILQGRGSTKAEMVLRGGKIYDLITGNFLEGDVAICGDTIVGTCDTYEAKKLLMLVVYFWFQGSLTHIFI